jgi:hypothetical protein
VRKSFAWRRGGGGTTDLLYFGLRDMYIHIRCSSGNGVESPSLRDVIS